MKTADPSLFYRRLVMSTEKITTLIIKIIITTFDKEIVRLFYNFNSSHAVLIASFNQLSLRLCGRAFSAQSFEPQGYALEFRFTEKRL